MTAPTGRRRGRPRVEEDEPSVRVHLTVSARVYDALCQRAQAARVSVPEVVRRTLPRDLRYTK